MAMVYMFACSMYTMETLGEMPVIEYYSHDSNTDDYDWSFFQAVYFTMVTTAVGGSSVIWLTRSLSVAIETPTKCEGG